MEILPGVHWIDGINGNCYLIDADELTLIDTGMPRKTKKILRYLTETLHTKPSKLKMIILTHGDIDHIGNASQLKEITGAKIAAHKVEAEYITGKKKRAMPKGGLAILFRLLSPLMRVKPFEIDVKLEDGDTIAEMKVIHTPGHTPGSIALYDARRKVLFTGDTLFYRDGKVKGPSEKFTMDMKSALLSIEKFRALDFDTILGGHGDPLKKGAAAMVRKFRTA